MKRLLIIDGHNLLFQMFFGFPVKLYNSKGKMYQGVLGFIGGLLKIIKKINPTHVVVLFDSEKRTVRSDVYEEYKSNRIDYNLVDEQDNPFSQLEDIFKSLECLGIKYKEIETYETDDVIASYVYKYRDVCEIFISSFDSDFFQLIDENVKVLRYRGDNSIVCDKEFLKKKYSINPNVYSLFKSLVGDSADNIKGVKGIGPKGAMAILANGDIDGLQAAIEQSDAKYLQKFPGIGPKASGQIILDLKGKLSNINVTDPKINDVKEALRSLGYNNQELKKIDKILVENKDLTIEELIKQS